MVTMAANDQGVGNFMTAVRASSHVGAPNTEDNIIAMAAWAACEGNSCGYNPLNTTGAFGHPHSTCAANNGFPVLNFTGGWADGVDATAQTIAGDPLILAILKAGGPAEALPTAIAASHWGTNPTCVTNNIRAYRANNATLLAALGVTVKGSLGGGAGPTADAGAAVPVTVPDPLSSLTSLVGIIGRAGSWITARHNIVRIVEVLAGLIGMIVALDLLGKDLTGTSPAMTGRLLAAATPTNLVKAVAA
jgi:hypothetical protein